MTKGTKVNNLTTSLHPRKTFSEPEAEEEGQADIVEFSSNALRGLIGSSQTEMGIYQKMA